MKLTAEQNRQRLDALRAASEREKQHSEDGRRLPPESECQHAGRWGRYCSGRKPKRAGVRLP